MPLDNQVAAEPVKGDGSAEVTKYKLISPDRTECPKGHPFTPENEGRAKHHTPYGNYINRVCKQCAREYREKRKKKLAAQRAKRQTPKGVRPSKEELAPLVERHTWVALGLHYGVSDVAVRKWAKEYELI